MSRFSCGRFLQTQHIGHGVAAGFLAGEEERGAEGTAGEGVAVGGDVADFDAFAGGGVVDGVFAHDVAHADGVHADGAFFAERIIAFAAMDEIVVEIAAGGFADAFSEGERGAGGSIFLLIVMCFDDFNVVGFAELAGDLGRDGEEDVDAEAGVGRLEDGNGGGGLVDELLVGRGEPGGADDEGDFSFDALGEEGAGGGGGGEVDDDIRSCRRGWR